METTLRNATLADLSVMLVDQHARKLDVVAPATAIRAADSQLVVAGTEPVLEDDGVSSADGTYRLTDIAVEGVADKLRIPLAYLRRIHGERPDLFDANVNGWLSGKVTQLPIVDGRGGGSPDPRSFLLRCFRTDDGPGICRAVLSTGYGFIDHLDVLTAALSGIREAGVDVDVRQCDLSDRKMYVKIQAPSMAALAPQLLAGYRSPFTGATGVDNPTVFAGFVLANSETGDGAATITPQITVQICGNGMTITKDVMRKVHLGGRLDHGVVQFSADTQQRALKLVEGQARDAVATFLSPGYIAAKVAELEAKAGAPLADPAEDVKVVTNRLKYTDQQTSDVLRRFIEGATTTAGGVMHAVTAAAQDQVNPDTAAAMEADALPALEAAFALSS